MSTLLPEGRYCVLSLSSSSSTLYVKEISFETDSTAFTRSEFDKRTLKEAPESTGAMPMFAQNLPGFPVQIIYGGYTTARDLTPNNSTNLAFMEEKLFYNRYTLTGSTSLSSDTSLVYSWAAQHRQKQDKYDAFLKYTGDGISYQDLITQQAETFSYLTSTGLSLVGSTLGNLSNLLIRSFSVNPVRDIWDGTTRTVLYEYSLVLDQINILSAAS